MSNPITGDFEGVLQISGATINRLMATLHQNAFRDSNVPSFPHTVGLRIGDVHPIDGVRGFVQGQIGVPRVELIHGVTDRFILEVGVRAWYRPDGGSEPLPGFIHGTVRAEYHIENIDPSCLGWGKRASQYLWIRVNPESVRFLGTTAEDRSALEQGTIIGATVGGTAAAEAANIAKVQKQIAGLLARSFEATPHPIKPGFRRDLMRSLNSPSTGSAVAVALGLSGEPSGSIASVDNPFLENADIGFGVNIAYILSLAAPLLDQVKKFNQTFPVHVTLPIKDFDTVYRVTVEAPTIEWEPHDWYGIVKVKVRGAAKTDSVAANSTFDVEQNVILQFDAGRGAIVASAAAPGVKAHAAGLYAGTVAQRTTDEVFKAVEAIAKGAINQIQPTLDHIQDRSNPLVDQLKTLDPAAAIGFTEGLFRRDGIIIRGFVALSRHRGPVVVQDTLATLDGHTALESWIPGGRIDRFDWSWTWTVTSIPGGKASLEDRFVLRRPVVSKSRWGVGIGVQTPLPGLDGWGHLCLTIKGVQVDADTGALVPVESTRQCRRFGLNISDHVNVKDERLFLYDTPELSKDVPFPQLSLVRVGDAHVESAAANTLVMLAGERWDEETASALRAGLEHCGRYDAGLAVLILFNEAALQSGGPDLIAEVEAFARKAGVPAIVNADVHGGWSRALEVRSRGAEPGWALIGPQGGVTWRHEGRVSGETLGRALDTFLQPSQDVSPAAARIGLAVGTKVIIGLDPSYFDFLQSKCPPFLLSRGVTSNSVLTFVQRNASSSHAHLRQLYADYGQHGDKAPLIVVVVDRADANQAESLKNELGIDFVTIPDPAGLIADRLGVGTWPTTVTVDDGGIVSAIATGVRPPPGGHCQSPAATN